MRSTTSLAAATLVASLVMMGLTRDAAAQQWEGMAKPPAGQRTAEYQTGTTDTWIRLSPIVTATRFGRGLDLKTRDRGRVAHSAGLFFEFDVADDLMLITFGATWQLDRVRRVVPGAANQLRGDTSARSPDRLHLGIALKNPELRLGIIQPILGFNIGMHNLAGYGRDPVLVEENGDLVEQEDFPPFADTRLVYLGMSVRLDVEASRHFRFGTLFEFDMPVYAMGDEVGRLPEGEFTLSERYLTLSASFYLSFLF